MEDLNASLSSSGVGFKSSSDGGGIEEVVVEEEVGGRNTFGVGAEEDDEGV